MKSKPLCRDCADHNGVCPYDGTFCSLDVQKRHEQLVKEMQRHTLKALSRAVKKVMPAASVDCLITALSEGLRYDAALADAVKRR